jgi:hypothetical protein
MSHSPKHARRAMREPGRHRNRAQASRSYASVAGFTAGNAMLATPCVTSSYAQFSQALGVPVERLKLMVAIALLVAAMLPATQLVSNQHHPSAQGVIVAAWSAAVAFTLLAIHPRGIVMAVALLAAAVVYRPLAKLRGAGSRLYPELRVTIQGQVRNWMIAAQALGGVAFALLVAFYSWRVATIALAALLCFQAGFLSRWMHRDWDRLAVPRRDRLKFVTTPGLKSGCAAVALGMLMLVLVMSGVQGALISHGTTPRTATELIGLLQFLRLAAIPYTGWGSRGAEGGTGRPLAWTSALMLAGGVAACATLLPDEPRAGRYALILVGAGLLESAGQALNAIIGGELSAVSLATATIVTAFNAMAYFVGALLSWSMDWAGIALFALVAAFATVALVLRFRARFSAPTPSAVGGK